MGKEQMGKEQIVEFELAEDVQEFIAENTDVDYSDNKYKQIILQANRNDLLKVVKIIDSPTKIINVEVVNDKFIEEQI